MKQIQQLLISKNLLPKGADDGVFGIQTKTALKKWQAIIGVEPDGMWSVATQTASDFYIKHGYTLAHRDHIDKVLSLLPAWKKLM